MCDARLMFCLINLLLFDVLVAVAVVVSKTPYNSLNWRQIVTCSKWRQMVTYSDTLQQKRRDK